MAASQIYIYIYKTDSQLIGTGEKLLWSQRCRPKIASQMVDGGLRDASTELRPYTRSLVFLVFQVYTLDHPLADLHPFSLDSWPAAFSTAWLGLRLRRFDCKAAFSNQHSSLGGLTARCMTILIINAFHAYNLSPIVCHLMSTYTDAFAPSSLLANASLRSCLRIHN